jgi:uncharacterized peroxidase-related enzyme
MRRYNPVEFDDACPAVRNIYADYLASTNSFCVPNWLKNLGSKPSMASAYWLHVKNTLVHGHLPMILKELVIFIISVRNGSPYCASAHAHAVLSLDRSFVFEDLIELADNLDSIELPEAMRVALYFATKLASRPYQVTEQDWDQLSEMGYDDASIEELIAIVSLAAMFNTYAISHDIPVDSEYRRFPVKRTVNPES